MEYLLVGEADLRWNICLLEKQTRGNICLLEEQTKDGIFVCWRSRLKREYLLVGGAD